MTEIIVCVCVCAFGVHEPYPHPVALVQIIFHIRLYFCCCCLHVFPFNGRSVNGIYTQMHVKLLLNDFFMNFIQQSETHSIQLNHKQPRESHEKPSKQIKCIKFSMIFQWPFSILTSILHFIPSLPASRSIAFLARGCINYSIASIPLVSYFARINAGKTHRTNSFLFFVNCAPPRVKYLNILSDWCRLGYIMHLYSLEGTTTKYTD